MCSQLFALTPLGVRTESFLSQLSSIDMWFAIFVLITALLLQILYRLLRYQWQFDSAFLFTAQIIQIPSAIISYLAFYLFRDIGISTTLFQPLILHFGWTVGLPLLTSLYTTVLAWSSSDWKGRFSGVLISLAALGLMIQTTALGFHGISFKTPNGHYLSLKKHKHSEWIVTQDHNTSSSETDLGH